MKLTNSRVQVLWTVEYSLSFIDIEEIRGPVLQPRLPETRKEVSC